MNWESPNEVLTMATKKNKQSEKSQITNYTPDEIEEIKQFLMDERNRIAKRLNSSAEALNYTKQAGEEAADIGSDNFIRETGISIMSEDRKKLDMISESLKKLSFGKFGICQDCGKPIGIARLRAKPYAVYCVDCKSKREQEE